MMHVKAETKKNYGLKLVEYWYSLKMESVFVFSCPYNIWAMLYFGWSYFLAVDQCNCHCLFSSITELTFDATAQPNIVMQQYLMKHTVILLVML